MGTSVYGMNLSSYDTAATFGTSAPTPSAFGASGGASGGGWSMNWGALGGLLGGVGQAMQGGIQVGTALAAGDFAANQASAFRWAGQQQAAELKRQKQAAIRNIGIVQQQGLDAATLRYNALGEEIARQRVAAAGSGIDLSSRTVGKAEQTSRKNAAWDVTRISRQTKIAADNWNEQAEAASRNSAYAKINGEYQARVAKIQGDLSETMGLLSGITTWSLGLARIGVGIGGMSAGGGGGGFS